MYTVYEDRDNSFAVQLVKNEVKLTTAEMQAITKIAVMFDGTEYDSDTYPAGFDWTTREDEGVVILTLGSVLTAPARDTKAELLIYTLTDTDGLVWDLLDIKVVDISA